MRGESDARRIKLILPRVGTTMPPPLDFDGDDEPGFDEPPIVSCIMV